MTEHLSQPQLEAYRQQQLSAAGLITVDDHLAACAACRQRVEAAVSGTLALLYADLQSAATFVLSDEGNAARHLTFDQLAGYADDSLAPAEQQFVADHLVSCTQCAHDADDLRAFKDVPISQPSHILAAAKTANATSWWHKLRTRFQALWPAPAFRLALAALLLTALTGWLIQFASNKKSSEPQLAGKDVNPTPALQITPAFPLQPSPQPFGTPPEQADSIVARLVDGGGQVTLNQRGELSGLGDLPAVDQRMIKDALTTQRLARSATLEGLNRRASSLMGSDELGNRFSLTAPVGKVVLTDRPAFSWTPLIGALGYVIEVYDERFKLIAKSEEVTGNKWTITQPLARGQNYSWQVKAIKDGQVVQAPKPPAPQARFRVLDQPQVNDITQARRTYRSSHLVLGLLYARAGLLDEAAQELRALQKANPDSEVVRRLLAQTRRR